MAKLPEYFMTRLVTLRSTVCAALVLAATASPALAYIGPGVGLGAIGTVIALIGAVFLAIAGFLWYPIKRMLRKGRKPAEASRDNADD